MEIIMGIGWVYLKRILGKLLKNLNYTSITVTAANTSQGINDTVIGQGDVMYVKPDDHTPRAYCNKEAPVYNYPGMSHTASGTGNLKLWWRMSAYPGMYPDR